MQQQTTMKMNEIKSDVGLNQEAFMKAIEIADPIKSIETYIEIISSTDSQLKSSLLNVDKNINNCWKYINERAKKELNSKSGHVPPSTVYSWAIHYYIESTDFLENELGNIKLTDQVSKPILTSVTIRKTESPEERIKRIREKMSTVGD